MVRPPISCSFFIRTLALVLPGHLKRFRCSWASARCCPWAAAACQMGRKWRSRRMRPSWGSWLRTGRVGWGGNRWYMIYIYVYIYILNFYYILYIIYYILNIIYYILYIIYHILYIILYIYLLCMIYYIIFIFILIFILYYIYIIYYIILYYVILCILYYMILYYIRLYYVFFVMLCYIILNYIILNYIILNYIILNLNYIILYILYMFNYIYYTCLITTYYNIASLPQIIHECRRCRFEFLNAAVFKNPFDYKFYPSVTCLFPPQCLSTHAHAHACRTQVRNSAAVVGALRGRRWGGRAVGGTALPQGRPNRNTDQRPPASVDNDTRISVSTGHVVLQRRHWLLVDYDVDT